VSWILVICFSIPSQSTRYNIYRSEIQLTE
jgi:hypothetical protein